MGEIRIVGPGKTCGYPYPVCKKSNVKKFYSSKCTDKSCYGKVQVLPRQCFHLE